MMKKFALFMIVLLAAAAIVVPAGASLTPISWGFPVLIQNASLTGLQAQTATAHDIESAAIDFGGSGFGCGLFGGAFPSIAQFADQGQSLTSLGFASQNQNMIFAYPYISIGGAPIASMGFF